MVIQVDDLVKSLLKKGFIKSNTSHVKYWFYVDGKRTHIWTMVSHSSKFKTVTGRLLTDIRIQMYLRKTSELFDFVECRLGENEYLDLLRERGELL
jgi:hypothetical protein